MRRRKRNKKIKDENAKKRKEFWEVIKKIKNENTKIGSDDKKMERGKKIKDLMQ